MAQDHLSQDGDREFRRSGWRGTCDCEVAFRGSCAYRDLGLERWRLVHTERDVPLSGRVCNRIVCGARAGPSLLRHDLPGTVRRPAEGPSGGMEAELTDYVRE